jgi:CHAT domain-containing protein
VLPPRDEIEAVARRAHELLARGLRTEQGPAERELRRLGEMLLAPVASRLGGGQRLLVAAEGALLYTPFAALPVPETGRLLVADHEIVTEPSATTLAAQRRRLAGRPAAAGVVAVMADPVFGPEDPRLTGVPSGVHPPGRRSGEDFRRLPYSAGEAAAILAVAPPGARFVATGFAADLESVRAHRLDGFRVVHFATHARVSAQQPERSGIILSRFDAAGRPRPGDLRSQEIYSLHLPAELVVLSACSTALGEELRGEGLVGFTQGFLAAGAARVMVSLWAVDDRSTAQLMERFYSALYTQGLSPAAALRSAQLALLREGDRSPYHWAGFVLQGEPG